MATYKTTSGSVVTAAQLAKMIAASKAANPQAAGSNSTPFAYQGAPMAPAYNDGSAQSTQQSIIPDPSVYEGETAQALQAYQNALSAIAGRRSNTLQNYGMTAHTDTNGNLSDYGIDPNNPYGAIQQLLGGEGSQLTQAQHASEDRGIGTVGLGGQGSTAIRQAGGAAQQQLGQQFVGEIGQEAQDQYGATSNFNAAKLQAQRDAIVSAIQNGYFTPAAQSTGGTSPPTGLATGTPGASAPGAPKPAARSTVGQISNKMLLQKTRGLSI